MNHLIFTKPDGTLTIDNLDTPEQFEHVAHVIERDARPLSVLTLSLLCAALARRIAKLEREKANG
jgi:hypothetical protein